MKFYTREFGHFYVKTMTISGYESESKARGKMNFRILNFYTCLKKISILSDKVAPQTNFFFIYF